MGSGTVNDRASESEKPCTSEGDSQSFCEESQIQTNDANTYEILHHCDISRVDNTATECDTDVISEVRISSDVIIEDEDNDSDINSEIYRFSDSDADSIPDIDEGDSAIDLDWDYLDEDEARNKIFRNDLAIWSLDYKIKQNALRALLAILIAHTKAQLPKDPRALLKTPKHSNVINMDTGHYCHMGLENVILKIIKKRIAQQHVFDSVNLFLNIDGAPLLGNSSEKGLWTILCKDYDCDTVYVIGIYHGPKKPEDPNIFLRPFVDEAKILLTSGLEFNKKLYSVRVHGFNMDSLAKSFVLCTKYHSGYSSCSKCLIEGEYKGCVCFPLPSKESLLNYCNTSLRTDDAFKNSDYLDEYQRGYSILNELSHVGLISNIPIDSMHAVYLGIVRQLIRQWLGDKGKKK